MPTSRLSKLTRPRTDGLVRRERLFTGMDAALERPIVWISAPPGAGKTSLVTSFLEARRATALWYQVDGNDADPATFFYYLRMAAEAMPGASIKALPLFQPEQSGDLEAFARFSFRTLFDGLPAGAVVALDNFQELPENSALQGALAAGFDEIPEGLHVIVMSRGAPPAQLARLRAAKRIAFIGWEEIKLTVGETARIAGHDGAAPDEITQAVFAQTGGWAAGVVLMLERLRQGGALDRLEDAENLDTIFDYFAGQVFLAAPAEHRDMLLRMSYLPRMTAELAQAMTGQQDAAELLAELSRRNLFVDRRFGESVTYQFHALFRRFLRARARRSLGAEEHGKLAHSAAALLQATGQAEDALPYFVETSAWNSARRLILSEAARLVGQGRRQTLRQWIQSLPMAEVEHDPWLSYWLAVAKLGTDFSDVARLLERAYLAFEAAGETEGRISAASVALQARISTNQPGLDADLWLPRLESALSSEVPPDDDPGAAVRASGTVTWLGSLFYTRPFTRSVGVAAEAVAQLLRGPLSDELRMQAATRLALYHMFHRDAPRAGALLAEAEPLLAGDRVPPSARQWWYFATAHHEGFLGMLDRCFAAARAGKSLSEDSGLAPRGLEFERLVANFMQIRPGIDAALAHLETAIAPLLPQAQVQSRLFAGILKALLEHAKGRHEVALGTALDVLARLGPQQLPTLVGRYALVIQAAALGGLGRLSEARDALQSACAGTDPPWNAELLSWCRAVSIDLLLREGHRDEALAELGDHLGALQATLYRRDLLTFREIHRRMLAEALQAQLYPEACRDAVRLWDHAPPGPGYDRWPWPVTIRALGGFEFGGEAVVPSRPGRAPVKVLELLKCIVALGGRDVPRARLADALWPDADGDDANRAFEVTLSRLRKLLGADDVLTGKDGRVTLNPAVCWIDIWAFEEAIGRYARARTGDEREACWSDISRVYRGPLLAGEPDMPLWLDRRRTLHQQWLACGRAWAEQLVADGRMEHAVRHLAALLLVDAAAEELWCLLIACQCRLGKHSDASRSYRECEAALERLLGTTPSAATRAAIAHIPKSGAADVSQV